MNSGDDTALRPLDSRPAACVSCHPDGRADGTLWTTAEGERRTISLDGGVDGRGWLHIASTHRNIRDFVDVTTEQRLGASLSDEDLDALAHYVATGIPHRQAPAQDEALVLQGQALFEERCADCHSGPRYTSGDPSASEPFAGGGERDDVRRASCGHRAMLVWRTCAGFGTFQSLSGGRATIRSTPWSLGSASPRGP